MLGSTLAYLIKVHSELRGLNDSDAREVSTPVLQDAWYLLLVTSSSLWPGLPASGHSKVRRHGQLWTLLLSPASWDVHYDDRKMIARVAECLGSLLHSLSYVQIPGTKTTVSALLLSSICMSSMLCYQICLSSASQVMGWQSQGLGRTCILLVPLDAQRQSVSGS